MARPQAEFRFVVKVVVGLGGGRLEGGGKVGTGCVQGVFPSFIFICIDEM